YFLAGPWGQTAKTALELAGEHRGPLLLAAFLLARLDTSLPSFLLNVPRPFFNVCRQHVHHLLMAAFLLARLDTSLPSFLLNVPRP
ncbi:MAG: hypothetical protein H7835_20685, partial [Magnetococcus sp. XQGC-1]